MLGSRWICCEPCGVVDYGPLYANELTKDDQGRLILNDSRSYNALQERAFADARSGVSDEPRSTLVEDGTEPPSPNLAWSARSSLSSSQVTPLFGFDVTPRDRIRRASWPRSSSSSSWSGSSWSSSSSSSCSSHTPSDLPSLNPVHHHHNPIATWPLSERQLEERFRSLINRTRPYPAADRPSGSDESSASSSDLSSLDDYGQFVAIDEADIADDHVMEACMADMQPGDDDDGNNADDEADASRGTEPQSSQPHNVTFGADSSGRFGFRNIFGPLSALNVSNVGAGEEIEQDSDADERAGQHADAESTDDMTEDQMQEQILLHVMRRIIIEGRLWYEVMFHQYGYGQVIPATDLVAVPSMTYENHDYDRRPPNEQDAEDETNLHQNDLTTYFNPTSLTSRVDPAGFNNIMPQTVVRIVNLGIDRNWFNLNGQLAVVLFFDRQSRSYIVSPYFAPHLRLSLRPENVSMTLYHHVPQVYAPPHGHDGIILSEPPMGDMPTRSNFEYAQITGTSITPICNCVGCFQMAAVNDLCQHHAMSHNIPRVTYYHDRYLFRIRRPRSKPPDEDDDDNSSQNSAYSMMAYNVEINGNRRGHHPRQRSKYQHHDLRAWLPDSGATDHFTNNLNDLHDTVACRRKVTVADGTVVYATAHGKCNLLMRDDVTKTPLRYTMRVYYVPGLTQRLFSFREFLRHPNHQIHQTSRFIQLDFGNGYYFTTPAVLGSQHQSNVNTALTLYQLPRNSQNSAVRTVDERETHKVASPKPLPRMQMDIAHARFGHRAYRSLLCGSLHHVWDDYLIVPASDDYCEGCKIAASRSAPRSQRGTPTPKAPFERIFIDIIPTPSGADGLTKDSAYPCYLLIVDHYSRFTWFEGMLNYTSQQVITCLKQFMVETRSLGRTKQIQYLRGDSDSSFRSAEFLSFADDSNIAASFAAPHHQEMNSICEGTWRTLDTMARAMRIHARLGNNFFGHSCRYAAHILNRLCPKGLLDENNNPTTPYYMAFGRKPRIGNIKVFGCPVSFRRYEPSNKGQRIPKKQQTQRSSIRGIFLGFPPKQAGYLIYLEDRIGTTHIMVSQDVTFDETFKSALATTYRPFQGAQFIRPVGDETMRSEIANHDDPDNETNPLATGSVDDILHPRIESSARGENTMETIVEEDIDTATDPAETSSDGVLPTHYYDEILDYVKNKNGTYKFQVQWNNGDITWEPEQYLREDSPGEFAVFLRETGCPTSSDLLGQKISTRVTRIQVMTRTQTAHQQQRATTPTTKATGRKLKPQTNCNHPSIARTDTICVPANQS